MQRDLNDIFVFSRVVEAGSFTGAGKLLDLPTSSISRRVSRLEERLGVLLLQRTTRAHSLTDAGRIFYEHVRRVTDDIEDAERAVTELQSEPSGTLRITAPADMGRMAMPLVAEFLALYPKVKLECLFTQRVVNLVDEGFDVAIRPGSLPDSTLIARKLLDSVGNGIFASPDYLANRGVPTTIDDLADHLAVGFASQPNPEKWRLSGPAGEREVTMNVSLVLNDFGSLIAAVEAGVGLAIIPAMLSAVSEGHGRIQHILPDWVAPASGAVWLVYPSRRHLPAKVAVFADFMKQRFADHVRACPEIA